MQKLFGPNGLFRKLDAAVVLATHAVKYEPAADNVISIDGTRKISLRTNVPVPLESEILPSDRATASQARQEAEESRDEANEELFLSPPNKNPTDDGEDQLEPPQGRLDGEFADYIYYFKSVRIAWVLIFLAFASCNTVCYYMSQVVLRWWTAENGQHGSKWMPLYACLAFGNLLFFGCLCWAMFLRLVPQSAASLHQILLDTVMGASYPFLAKTDIGALLNRFSQDMTVVDSQLPTGLVCTVIYLFWTFGSLALICTGSRFMAATTPIVFVVLYFLQKVYLRTSRRLRLIDLEMRSPLYSHFLDTLAGLSSIKSFSWEKTFTEAMIVKLDESQAPYYLLFCAQRWLNLVLDLIVAGLAIIVVTLAVKLKDSTDASSLGLSLNNILSFNEILSLLLQFWTQLEVSLGAIKRTRDFAAQTPRELQVDNAPQIVNPAWPEQGAVEIRNIRSGFSSEKTFLDGVTMSIQPGEKIGFCGRTGSGKSSLLLAVLGLLEPSAGSISIDGVNLQDVSRSTIRESIITIPQDPYLFDRSVRLNVDPHRQYEDVQLVAALSKVNLWSLLQAHGGLDGTMKSDILSQGQKQLFSVARAILRKERPLNGPEINSGRKVALLDEATSNVDRETDAFMQRIIREEFVGYTILVVAHRLDTIPDSDRVAVLDAGKLVEFDTPQVLLAQDSSFAALCRLSTGVTPEPSSLQRVSHDGGSNVPASR